MLCFAAFEIYPSLVTGIHNAAFTIEKNATALSIAKTLKENHLIIDPIGFVLIVRIDKSEKELKSGEYNVRGINSVFDIINLLKKGTFPEQVKVTIPEGFTVRDIAQRLYETGVISDEDALVKKALPSEGYLFPDTYFFVKDENTDKIIQTMKRRFNEVLPKDFSKRVKEKALTEREAVILASIVEKEAKLDKDRPFVASVFLNRLKVGMPLQSDATINYVLKDKKPWLSEKDLALDSPYNTYKYKGLPPGPICNPGLQSLLSVVNAPKTDYYYFLTKPDGEAVFAKTLEEHNRNIEKYYGG